MASQNIQDQERKYVLNNFQQFFVKTEELKKIFKNLQFPILILDMEFFNRSHNLNQLKTNACDLTGNEAFVYTLQLAIYQNLKMLIKSGSKKRIKNLTLERKWNETNYSFENKYYALIKHFIGILGKEKIKTIVVAGASNDKRIINLWLNKNASNKNDQGLKIAFWDVYPTLEKTMAFTNFNAQGNQFWNPKNLKRGFCGEASLSLPSLKKFFDYMAQQFPHFEYNDDFDIHQLSHEALEFFCQYQQSEQQYHQGQKALAMAKEHCFNDVYKIITLIKFWIHLIQDKKSN